MIAANRSGPGLLAGEARVDDLTEHELVGLDGNGILCACGTRAGSWLEHLGEVALLVMDAPPSIDDKPERRARRTWDARARSSKLQQGAATARRIMAERAAASERRLRELGETGLTDFNAQIEWLAAQRTPLERVADDLAFVRMIREAAEVWRRIHPDASPLDLSIRDLNGRGFSDAEIAHIVGGVAPQTVQAHRSAMGLPVQSRGRRSDIEKAAMAVEAANERQAA